MRARKAIHPRQHRLHDFAADVLEVAVDAHPRAAFSALPTSSRL